MATNYIKVRPYVAKRLGILDQRYRFADGCVLLWEKDLSMVDRGWVFRRDEVVARIGGLWMDPMRTREEQAKTAAECTPLPGPTDREWADPEEGDALEQAPEEEGPDGTGDPEADEEGGGE